MRWLSDATPRIRLLFLMALAMPMAFSTWMVVINNFAVERAAFDGAEIGMLQSLREVPGFMAFAVILILPFIREQRLALLSLALLAFGTAVTGYFPSVFGLYVTTVVASIGFHYYETVNQSLQMQWLERDSAGELFGRLLAVGSLSGLVAYSLVFAATRWWDVSLEWVLFAGGCVTLSITLYCAIAFAQFEQPVKQNTALVLRKRYSLYYFLTFLSGARRQIFLVFAAFLMVEKFAFSASSVALMFLLNGALNFVLAPRLGAWIDRVVKTYFQKIADPADIAPSAGVAFTINHIAAVGLPAVLGLLWVAGSPGAVFLIGALFALCSLALAQCVPNTPAAGNEMQWPGWVRRASGFRAG